MSNNLSFPCAWIPICSQWPTAQSPWGLCRLLCLWRQNRIGFRLVFSEAVFCVPRFLLSLGSLSKLAPITPSQSAFHPRFTCWQKHSGIIFFFLLLIWLGAQLSQRALRHASIMRSFDDLVLLILLINLDRSLGERSWCTVTPNAKSVVERPWGPRGEKEEEEEVEDAGSVSRARVGPQGLGWLKWGSWTTVSSQWCLQKGLMELTIPQGIHLKKPCFLSK